MTPHVLPQFGDVYTTSGLIEKLRDTHAEYDDVVSDLERLERRSSTLEAYIVMNRKAQEAYEKVHDMYHQQKLIAHQIKAELHERDQ